MLYFCPTCANLLIVEEGSKGMKFSCTTCAYIFPIKRCISYKFYPKLKALDDVLGGAAAWANVDATDEPCPKCTHPRAYFMQVQTRSADEPMTTFYKCCNQSCGNRWKEILYKSASVYRKNLFSVVKIDTPLSMNIIKVIEENLNLDSAIAALNRGSVIAVPTDTIYGFAASAQDIEAVDKIYDIKERSCAKPIAICVGSVRDVYMWGEVTISYKLLSALLPGPVTLIFERTQYLNPYLNPESNLIGIRIPCHPFIRNLAYTFGSPLALTSANTSGQESPIKIDDFKELWKKVEKVFDGGQLGFSEQCRKGSTVVDLSVKDSYRIIREGSAFIETSRLLRHFGLKHID